jgi:hypothetical protein
VVAVVFDDEPLLHAASTRAPRRNHERRTAGRLGRGASPYSARR